MNVSRTRKLNLCLSCEICHAICPVNAVSMKYVFGQFLPHIDEAKCRDCGHCLNVCPGIDVDPTGIRYQTVTENMFDGPYLNTFTAYSKDLQIRARSTSGGIITALILELINYKEYDAAFVLRFDRFDNKPARLILTKKNDDIVKSMGSKYIPASVYDVVDYPEERTERQIHHRWYALPVSRHQELHQIFRAVGR